MNTILVIGSANVDTVYTVYKIPAPGETIMATDVMQNAGGKGANQAVAAAKAGAAVTHVDAAKGMVNWAKENAVSSGVADRPVRWIVDDCAKFVAREIRRGHHYDGIIMDPPSYGRGPNGEVWKLEERIYEFVELCSGVIADNAEFVILNSYTTGLSPSVMEYLLGTVVQSRFGGAVSSDEIGLDVTESGLTLPCGSTAIWRR